MTLGLVGLVALLAVIGCFSMLIAAVCARMILLAWTTRPRGVDDTLHAMSDKVNRQDIQMTDIRDLVKRFNSRWMREGQRKKKPDEDEETPEPKRKPDLSAAATVSPDVGQEPHGARPNNSGMSLQDRYRNWILGTRTAGPGK